MVHGREQQRPGDDHEGEAHDAGDDGRHHALGRRQPEDGAEQVVDTGRAVPGALARGVDGEEEHAQPEDPGEDAPDHHVVRPGPPTEHTEAHGHQRRRREQADPGVDPERERGQGSGVGGMTEGVRGEDLGPEHEEVADEPRGQGDERPRQQAIADERVAEEISQTAARRAGHERRHVPTRAWSARAGAEP